MGLFWVFLDSISSYYYNDMQLSFVLEKKMITMGDLYIFHMIALIGDCIGVCI
jgi:hypothetical protein